MSRFFHLVAYLLICYSIFSLPLSLQICFIHFCIFFFILLSLVPQNSEYIKCIWSIGINFPVITRMLCDVYWTMYAILCDGECEGMWACVYICVLIFFLLFFVALNSLWLRTYSMSDLSRPHSAVNRIFAVDVVGGRVVFL